MHRTNTTNYTSFTLPPPNAATFDFPSSSTASGSSTPIRIAIPSSSNWYMPLHWHPSELHHTATSTVACKRVTCVSGALHVYTAQGILGSGDTLGYKGMSVKYKPGQRTLWNRTRGTPLDLLTVDLEADHILWRNVCSAVLDQGIFPQLNSTPLWLKVLFAILSVTPSLQAWLLNLMLRIQLQAVFFAHDFHVYHGYVPFTWPWMMQPFGGRPPNWAKRLQLQSLYVISRVVMTSAYCLGTLFLGMKGEYAEYTPSSIQENSFLVRDEYKVQAEKTCS